MQDVNIAGLDLNLLPALEALLSRRNVTRAAADVGLSQPAMSRALARLRDLLGDALLVRTTNGYVLTARALAIQPQLAAALQPLREMFRPHLFDPGSERRLLRLAASDAQTVLLVPGLMARLARDAPGVDLRVEAYGADLLARLESGALDLAFALSSTPLPPGVHSEIVGEDRLTLVMRQGHPAAHRPWTLADYGTHQHVGIALLGDGQSEIDARLAAAGLSRRIAMVTPHFMAALAAVAATDMVTTISAALARRFAGLFDLVLHAPPFDNVELHSTLVFSRLRAADPFSMWVRGVIRDVARTVEPSGTAPL
ncbi:LysR family transcriptional regulator [Lichenifustis flavocetrariae]|uniref:LysR family transcriptional regulator n=1 Tax=Lichenifustis flavocetrariae TaxID=2949735 RepID=A0AA41Z0J9_9HYPH|nr:LysR family transcriptional regulator [Lichenifustis flavocetrariae]MCW6511961.1 LysR family transcriptional regulator [Lichenifustis flavocetrariae]